MGVEKEKGQSWLTTLPGVCAGAATLITAIGGFLVIYTDRCSSGTKILQASTTQEKEPHLVPANEKEPILIPANRAAIRAASPATYPGRYPQASSRLLTQYDLQSLSREDLRIMRNEIFARHGMVFRSDDLRSYFGSQSWYIPRYDDVSSRITGTEKQNIELIKSFE